VVKVTVPGTSPAAPASGSKLPGKIAFEASGVFVVNPDGTGLKKIAEGHSPVFSPDGKRVAFISDDDSAINSVDLNGQNLQYHCPTEGHLARIIRWSPTGKWVAVDSLNEDGTSEVRLCDMTYKGIGALETVYRANDEAKLVFDWSLDEKKILWQSGSRNSAGEVGYDLWYSRPDDPVSNWDIVAGRKYEISLAEGYMYVNARISPTNKTVAVIGNQLFFMSVPGYTSSYNGLVLDQFENVDGVAWSPDSAAVLVSGVYKDNPGMFLYYFESKKVVQLTDYLSSGYLDWTRK
jgi:Tol biopolymer transport system component